ncbi:hypothetical protein CIHG_01470 [Coccidioides immitis H538.4]|uniref:Uncharacterized protein n=1 Tax=Coccidioides immitis H538.4 TaxID=396776 RepID=A0A0J8RGF1_COCIT|nr:hypothetical protein CIHG_01470 [Coccidioides immitis H538.4]
MAEHHHCCLANQRETRSTPSHPGQQRQHASHTGSGMGTRAHGRGKIGREFSRKRRHATRDDRKKQKAMHTHLEGGSNKSCERANTTWGEVSPGEGWVVCPVSSLASRLESYFFGPTRDLSGGAGGGQLFRIEATEPPFGRNSRETTSEAAK